jgi:hypothetical protein
MVELQSDVRFLGLPADRAALAHALAGTLAGAALQRGHRGAQGFGAAVDLMARVADLGLAAGERLMQIELNPVTVGPHGAAAVDAQVVIRG